MDFQSPKIGTYVWWEGPRRRQISSREGWRSSRPAFLSPAVWTALGSLWNHLQNVVLGKSRGNCAPISVMDKRRHLASCRPWVSDSAFTPLFCSEMHHTKVMIISEAPLCSRFSFWWKQASFSCTMKRLGCDGQDFFFLFSVPGLELMTSHMPSRWLYHWAKSSALNSLKHCIPGKFSPCPLSKKFTKN